MINGRISTGNATSDLLLAIGDFMQYATLLPSIYIVYDYGFRRTFVRVKPTGTYENVSWYDRPRRYVPFWYTGLGLVFFLMAFSFMLVSIVVFMSLFLGATYPGREIVRIVGYGTGLISMIFMAITYALERETVYSVIAPKWLRNEQRDKEQLWEDTLDPRLQAKRQMARRTRPTTLS